MATSRLLRGTSRFINKETVLTITSIRRGIDGYYYVIGFVRTDTNSPDAYSGHTDDEILNYFIPVNNTEFKEQDYYS